MRRREEEEEEEEIYNQVSKLKFVFSMLYVKGSNLIQNCTANIIVISY